MLVGIAISPVRQAQRSAGGGLLPPDTPTGLTADSGDGIAIINFNTTARATLYHIWIDGTLNAVLANNAEYRPYLTNGTTYSVTISALNSAGESAQSDPVSVTPESATPSPAPAWRTASGGYYLTPSGGHFLTT